MNAEEARKTALKIVYDRVNSQYNRVKDEIEGEVKDGKLHLIYLYDLCDEVIDKLRLEGFTVKRFESGMNEYSYEIKW